MANQSEKLKIGLFVVGSAVLVIGMIIWLGAFSFFESSQTVVAYFTESVQGLESDSPGQIQRGHGRQSEGHPLGSGWTAHRGSYRP